MKTSTSQLVMIIAILVLSNSGIYFVTAYSQMQESNDTSSTIQTMLFVTAAIVYLPLGIWMTKTKLCGRTPYVIASLVSIVLIGLYVVSRTVNLPIVGIQHDVGLVDILAKISQGSIVVISLLLLQNWKTTSRGQVKRIQHMKKYLLEQCGKMM